MPRKFQLLILIAAIAVSFGLEGICKDEQKAKNTQELVRDKFRLSYPANWKIDTADKDYDPDLMFSIDAPGSAFVMFIIGKGAIVTPEKALQAQISSFEKAVDKPVIAKFEKYGQFSGKGAEIKGRIMGLKTTVRLFSFQQNGMTVMITQQCPDEDLKSAQAGFDLIENSLSLPLSSP